VIDLIRHEYIDQYIRNTIKRETGILKELEQYAMEHGVPIIQPEVARMLSVIIRIHKPEKVLEVGTAIGYSAITIAGVLGEKGLIDTVEISEEKAILANDNIYRAGLKHRINIIVGDAADVLKCLDKNYDMIFMDAAKGQYPDLLPECLRMLNSGGVLISDNILFKGLTAKEQVKRKNRTISNRLKQYLSELCNHPDLETSIIPIGDGVSISYKK